jgi:hypothetical protein
LEIRNLRMERYTFFLGETPLSPPQKKPASAAKPISFCLYKTLTLMLYNLINLPYLMGARRSCGQSVCLVLYYCQPYRTQTFEEQVWHWLSFTTESQ